jgi:hypothetical protein
MFLVLQFLRPAVAMPANVAANATEHNNILMIFPEHNTKGARMCTPKTTGPGPKVSKLQATDSWHTSLTRRNVGGSPTPGNDAETTGWLGREDSNLGIPQNISL